VARPDEKAWPECVRFAHEFAALKLGVESHVERMIDREAFHRRIEAPVEQGA
jgi:hypothetical protein